VAVSVTITSRRVRAVVVWALIPEGFRGQNPYHHGVNGDETDSTGLTVTVTDDDTTDADLRQYVGQARIHRYLAR
jgi:hypothetical protein